MLIVLAACAPNGLGPATLQHRPTADPCAPGPVPPEPSCEDPDRDACSVHADCTEGARGQCHSGSYGCFCAYDRCTTDAECPSDAACGCDAQLGVHDVCIEADCHTDADCPSGRCQASPGPHCGAADEDEELSIGGWYCATLADMCNSDRDCEDYDRCMHVDGRFECSHDYSVTCE